MSIYPSATRLDLQIRVIDMYELVPLARLFLRTVQVCALVSFVSVSVLFTTNLLFVSPVSALISGLFDYLVLRPSSWMFSLTDGSYKHRLVTNMPKPTYYTLSDKDPAEEPLFSWTSSDVTLDHGLGLMKPVSVDRSIFLSKAFMNSMRPSNIRPYFYRAKGHFENDDITITTLITSNRFEVFPRLVEKYQGLSIPLLRTLTYIFSSTGPISVTVHIKDVAEHVQEVLETLHEMYTSSEAMQTFVDVHLVVDAFDRQFNTWRNIARLFARTDYVMMLDIDFYLCTDFRSVIRQSFTISSQLREGRAALVVPAFEYIDYHEGTNYATFPRKKLVCPFTKVATDNRSRFRRYFLLQTAVVLACFMHFGAQGIIVLNTNVSMLPLRGTSTK